MTQDVKLCNRCHAKKPLSEFSTQGPKKLQPRCKPCNAAYAKELRLKKPQTEEQKEAARERSRLWRQKNPDWAAKQKIDWAKKYPDRRAAGRAKYEYSKVMATPKWLTKSQLEDIQKMYWLRDDIKAVTGELYQVDHIVPIKGKNICGLHVPWNLQILPAEVNNSKGNRYYE